ncbi:phage major capsid protein [Agromyces kandeliae]|uniref:Phage major capsid protein n=1 Tax=Agromyces kandeliae TaxID=2666141 RepID=A0A6L5R7M5_9MICO|nr:phage major capsid protein [Agromyces kandeliae]MRX45327.1 phage major capsid protein [Agromyces kandeliae]
MPTLAEQRDALLTQANAIVAAAKNDHDRPLTDAESADLSTLLDSVDALDERLAHVKRSDEIMRRLFGIGGDADPKAFDDRIRGDEGQLHLALTSPERRVAGTKLAQAMLQKSLTVTGETVSDVPVTGPIAQGQVPSSILDLLPLVRHAGPVFRYLRQTTRTFAAAVVAPGAVKPESSVGVTSVDGGLQVIAHVAGGINVYDVLDAPSLARWLSDEMLYGLGRAVEQEILLGDGTAGHLTGILNTSGIQTQAAGPDVVTTIRSAITKVQSLGYSPGAVILNPADWEAAETLRATSGVFDFAPGAPVDAAAQRLWGVPVALSPTITAGVAAVLDPGVVGVDVDTQGMRLQWSEANADDFTRNLLTIRAEGRFGVSVYQPSGVVMATLPA